MNMKMFINQASICEEHFNSHNHKFDSMHILIIIIQYLNSSNLENNRTILFSFNCRQILMQGNSQDINFRHFYGIH